MNNPKIHVENVSHRFRMNGHGMVSVLKNITFHVHNGEFLAIVGPSGCGKSTLLNIMAGLEKQTSGKIINNSKETAMIFQNFAIFPWLNVFENVEFGLKMQGVKKIERDQIVKQKIKEVGLQGFEDKYPRELSGGMKQRVGIARALAIEPNVLFMDEPFSSLDALTADVLRKEVLELWGKYQMTAVMVTHIIEEAVEMADRIIVLSKRPAEIVQIVTVDLPKPRDKRSPEFYKACDQIRKLIEI